MPTARFDVVTGELARADAAQLAAVGGTGTFDPVRDVVCLARGEDGTLLGASFVEASEVPLVGGRRFWLYHHALAPAAHDQRDALLAATFAALDRGFDGTPGAPIGLCLVVEDIGEMRRRPEAHWEDPPMLYVGYVPGPRQVRVAYFVGARIGKMGAHAG